jgi:hypothetical protein
VAILDRVPLLRFHLDSGHAKLERGYDRCNRSRTGCHWRCAAVESAYGDEGRKSVP